MAWSAALSVLLGHGLTIEATAGEAEALMLDVIKGTIADGMSVADWLAERLIAIENLPF